MPSEHPNIPIEASQNTETSTNPTSVENSLPPARIPLDFDADSSVNGSMNQTTMQPLTQAPAMVDPFAALTQGLTPKRAVSYLRVSTREQAERGGREEGFSIPAQREANKRKAQSMGALVIKEFVERGVSGTSMNRPALQAMLKYIEDPENNVDMVIVHKVDRLARNRADDVALNQRFDNLGYPPRLHQ